MIETGKYNELTVARISDYGLYLADEEGNEVLLPNRYVSLKDKVGDVVKVFVYHDSEDRIVATTETPLVTAGHTAYLEAVDKTVHGAFFNWGLTAKDLFMPNRNMVGRVETGKKYVVYAYRDEISGRVVVTMSFRGFISNDNIELRRGDEVRGIVALESETGFRVIINDKNWGVIYKNQIFSPVNVGDRITAYVRKITEDNRVDLNLQKEGFDQVKESVDRLMGLLADNGGFLSVNDNSSPEDVSACTGMSKKVFKRALGFLLKKGIVTQAENGIKQIG